MSGARQGARSGFIVVAPKAEVYESRDGEHIWSKSFGGQYTDYGEGVRTDAADKWGTAGTGPGEFDWLTGIAVGAGGNVYVTDTENHRIQVFK